MERKEDGESKHTFLWLKTRTKIQPRILSNKMCEVETNSAGWKGGCPIVSCDHIYSSFTSIYIIMTENTSIILQI